MSKKVLKIFKLFENSVSVLDGKSKNSAKNIIYKLIDKYTKGIYSDEFWTPYREILKTLQDSGIDYEVTESFYDREIPPKSKTWKINIYFIDNKNKKIELNAYIKAHGAGSVIDPLSKYDLIFVFTN